MAQPADDHQQNADDVLMQSQRLERSEQPSTESSTVQTVSRDHAECVLDTLRYVEPMKLGMYQMRQAAVELPVTTDHTICCV